MSSLQVRNDILDFLTSNSPETFLDLTAEFLELKDFLDDSGVPDQGPWVGVQFLPADEFPVDVLTSNTKGTFREEGVILIHIVAMAKISAHTGILQRAEAIRDLLRGRRIGQTVVESISPPRFGSGASLNFEGGYTSATIELDYKRDLIL